jgi:hypothetical protein
LRIFRNTRTQKGRSRFFNGRVKGGALYISVIISCIIAVLLSLLLLLSRHNQRSVYGFASMTQLQYNLESGLQMAMSAYFNKGLNHAWLKNSVNDDSIRVKKVSWGAYLVIVTETKNPHQYLSRAGLYGGYMPADTGLLVSDNSRPTGMSGSVVLKADCYLPRAGIKPAYIEGQSYSAGPENNLHIKISPPLIPQVASQIYGNMEEQFNFDSNRDSLVTILPESYARSFTSRTAVFQGNSLQLHNTRLSDNIKLVCEEVLVDSTAKLENILLVCKHARFRSGFKGSVHVIAEDSISMEEKCMFTYPSSFVLGSNNKTSNQKSGVKYILFNKNCRFYGGIVALSGDNVQGNGTKALVKLNAESEVNGLIYSGDYLHLEGKVNATCIANKLLIQTNSAVYENHLLGCEVNPRLYSGLLAVPLLFSTREKLLCCNNVK